MKQRFLEIVTYAENGEEVDRIQVPLSDDGILGMMDTFSINSRKQILRGLFFRFFVPSDPLETTRALREK